MFTGIVKGVGRVLESREVGGDRRFSFDTAGHLPNLGVGASFAVNGACLTAVACEGMRAIADVSLATLSQTTLGGLGPGAAVNLEPALAAGEPLDGHLVTGHVDGVGTVQSVEPEARSFRLAIELPAGLERYVAVKGAVAVDGVSLTVNAVRDRIFEVNIIPHTHAETIIGAYGPGTAVNIEVDIIARYLERMLQAAAPVQK